MRKGERGTIAKRLRVLHENLSQVGLGQLEGAIWYFENDSEVKGFDSAWAALENLIVRSKEVQLYLKRKVSNT